MAAIKIGDVFLGLLPDDKGFEKAATSSAQKAGDKAGRALGSQITNSWKEAFNPGKLMAAAGAFIVADKALSFLADAANAAREEDAAIATLTQSIQANDKAWDGNIDAVEKVIESRQDLAFADDAQRQSIQGLVAITGDLDKALELNRTAMDLARLRNIDLTTASDILGRVYGGNTGILSRYGIVLEKGATSTEALAKIQEMAAGQAEAYAETSQGQAEKLQIAWDNMQEDLGTALLPLLDELVETMNDDVIPAVKTLFTILSSDKDAPDESFESIEGWLNGINDAAQDSAKTLHELVTGEFGHINEAAKEMGVSFEEAEDAIYDWMHTHQVSFAEAKRAVLDNFDPMARATDAYAARWKGLGESFQDGTLAMTASVEELATTIPESLQKAIDAGEVTIREAPGGFAAAIRGGGYVFAADMDSLAAAIPGAVSRAKAEAEEIGRQFPGDLADAILGNISDLEAIETRINEILTGSVSDAVVNANLAAQLFNPQLAAGLTGNSSEAKDALLNDVVDPILKSVDAIPGQGFEAGEQLPAELADAIDANGPTAIQAMKDLLGDSDATLGTLADFAEDRGWEGIAAYIRGQERQRSESLRKGGQIARDTAQAMRNEERYFGDSGGSAAGSYSRGLDSPGARTEASRHGAGLAGSAAASMNFDAYTLGQNIGYAFANGLGSSYSYLEDKAYNLAHYGTRFLRGESPPKEGPLKHIDDWGRNVGEAWVGGLAQALGAMQLGGLLGTPSPMAPVAAGAAGTAVSGGNTWILNVGGVPRTFNSRDAFMNALDDLTAFGDGRAAGG